MYRLFFVLISFILAQSSMAGQVADLYHGQAPVDSQSEQDRNALAPDLLRQVILKVVGDRKALAAADLTPALQHADQYIEQFQYERRNNIKADLTQPDQLSLLLSFNKSAVDSVINRLGLPIWGSTRPIVLVWLALDDGNSKSLVGGEDDSLRLPVQIRHIADQRGLPVLLPVMDLQDQTQLTFNDIWTGNKAAILAASQRYDAPIILTARISLQGDNAQIRWQSLLNGKSDRWQSQGVLTDALRSGVETLVDGLSHRFSQVATPHSGHTVSMLVSNVRDYHDYSRLIQHLSRLQYVTAIDVTGLSGNVAHLDISFKGDIAALDQTLAMGQILSLQNSEDGTAVKHYRLIP